MKNLLFKLLNNPLFVRALHTFWQGALAYVIYAVDVQHVALHSVADARLLAVGAIGAGLSALKTLLAQAWKQYRG